MNDVFDVSEHSRGGDEHSWQADPWGRTWSLEVDRISRERASLASALGEHHTQVVNQLYAQGLRSSTANVVEWIPAIEIAWRDGADETDRRTLRAQLAADHRASEASVALLEVWLTTRPSESLLAAGQQALRSLLQTLDDADRTLAVARIQSTCEAAGCCQQNARRRSALVD
jgi:hypothetical protein